MDTCKHPHLNLYNLIPCMALRPPTTLASQRLLWSILIGKLVVKRVLIHRILCLSCEHALVIVCVRTSTESAEDEQGVTATYCNRSDMVNVG